jgi:hypothetical protein
MTPEFRPSAVFSEPQAYASYMIPLMFLAWHFKNYFFSIIVSISILLTGSSFGILILSMFLVYVLFVSLSIKNSPIFIILLVSLFSLYYFGFIDLFLEKTLDMDLSKNIRVA